MDKSKLKLIGFDMDGTLFNSFSVSYDAICDGFEAFRAEIGEDVPVPSWEKIKRLIGLPSYEFYPAMLPSKHKESWKVLHMHVGQAEEKRLMEGRGRCFDGVHRMLSDLKAKGYVLGCLSNASSRYFDAVLNECGLRDYFSKLSFLGEDFSRRKVDVLKEWAREYGSEGSIIYIGDRREDIEAAHGAGVGAIGVTWGYGSAKELEKADIVVDKVSDLMEIFSPD